MLAFHNDKKIKTKYLTRVRNHIKADNLVRGIGWENGKGCAVGCTLENYNHAQYEVELGIPEWLARLEDTLFENMSKKKSRTWPKDFLNAIPVGSQFKNTKRDFLIVVLNHSLKSLSKVKFDKKKFPEVEAAIKEAKAAIKEMIRCHKKDLDLTAARLAVWSAESAADSAAESAESAAESARSAARSAESAARSAARSAESAAESAWSAAESAAWSAAAEKTYDYFADELLKILRRSK